ncbi:hypothetical protein Taro_042895, partial [Colocasia esculenta]|nr:hypothetical protein [Colocasia esculenta]
MECGSGGSQPLPPARLALLSTAVHGEEEAVLASPVVPRSNRQEHLSTGIGCNDDHSEAEKFKTNNEVKRVGPLDFSSFMQVSDQSILGDQLGAYGSYSDVDNLTNADQNGHKVASYSLPPPPFEIVKKETEFYMDKAVTEMELPKMIVCYKEGCYHIIKDICVDEGLHSFDRVLVQNPFLDEKVYTGSKFDTDDFTHREISDSLKSLHLNGQPTFDHSNEVTEHAVLEIAQGGGFISRTMGETVSSETQKVNFNEVLIPTQESERCYFQEEVIHTHNENVMQCSLASLLELDRGSTDTAEEIEHAPGTKELIPLHKLGREHCHADLPSSQSGIEQPQLAISDSEQPKSGNKDAEESAKESQSNEAVPHQSKSLSNSCSDVPSISGSTTQTFFVPEGSNGDQVDEGTLEEANSTAACVNSEKVKDENIVKYSLDIGSSGGNIVAFDIDSEPLATIPEKDSRGTSEIQQSELLVSGGMLESTSTDGPTVASRPSFSHDYSDANFHGPASLSGGIAYSGQIPYSGSISLRSDSSTTSTRSFAFPILQSEWNSSPILDEIDDRDDG